MQKISGFEFIINAKINKIQTMDNFIEISMPFDNFRTVYIRKTQGSPFADISGCKKDYPVKGEISLTDEETLYVQGNGKKLYVVNFWYDKYDYSIYCKRGMTIKDIVNIYELIKNSAISKNKEK